MKGIVGTRNADLEEKKKVKKIKSTRGWVGLKGGNWVVGMSI